MTEEIRSAAASSTSDVAPSPPAPEFAGAKSAAPSVEPPGAGRAELNVVPDISGPSAPTGDPAEATAAASIAGTPARGNRFALLAASVALAAAVGALAGGLGASGFIPGGPAPEQAAPTAAAIEKSDALQGAINRMQTELAALRTSVETATRATNGQFSKITERFDRVERTQTERATKLIKAIESLERVERRAEAAPVREITSSVPAPQPVVATPVQSPQSPQAAQPPQPPIIEGWVVRTVYRGTAILQNRRVGTVDVEPGDVLPGAGRVESIKKRDGQWVVVTSKGLITSVR